MEGLLPIIVSAVALATLLNVLLKRVNVPTIIGYIATGMVIGPVFGIQVHDNPQLEHVAEFGVVFLMFAIGLELSVDHLKQMRREVLGFGAAQVIVTAAVVASVAHFALGLALETSVVVGSGLALSSTAIVLKLLNESGKMHTTAGRNALGVLIFQDIAVIPILLMITIVTSEGQSTTALLLRTAGNAAMALAILIVGGRYGLRLLFKTVSEANSKEIFMGLIFFVVIGASWIAHHFGFSYSLGAFVAGMMIADTIHKYQVEADLIPFRDSLLGVFFVTVGLQIDIDVLSQNLLTVLWVGAAIMVTKAACVLCIVRIACTTEVSVKTAIMLAQVGEFALVVFSLVLANDMMSPVWAQILMAVVVMTMVLTPLLIGNAERVAKVFGRRGVAAAAREPQDVIGEHIIVCGYGAFGAAVSTRLEAAGINHIVIASDTAEYMKARAGGRQVAFGDPADRALLLKLNIRRAIGTIIAMDDFDRTKQVSAAIALLGSDLKIIAKVGTDAEKDELAGFHHELVVDGNGHAADVLVRQISRSRLLAQQTAQLQYLAGFSTRDPQQAIRLIFLEQARLLEIMSSFFRALREGRDMLHIKACHDSFNVLSEIVREAVGELTRASKLTATDYERINILMDSQGTMESTNALLERLGREVRVLEDNGETRRFARVVVEGLDAILLSLKEIAKSLDMTEIQVLKNVTGGEAGGLARIRESYLGDERSLSPEVKGQLLSATNLIERLRALFRAIGENYEKLAPVLGAKAA